MKSKFPVVWGLLVVWMVALVAVAEVLAPDVRASFLKEGGVVETLSVVGYGAAAVLLLWQTIGRNRDRWTLFVAVACLALRELDFHKRFTTMSIFKSRFFSIAEVPGAEKIVGLLITIALLACIVLLVKTHFRSFFDGIRMRSGVAVSVLLFGAMLVLAKSLDGLARKLKPLGIEVSESGREFFGGIEEVMELTAAMLLLFVVACAMRPVEPGSLEAAAPDQVQA